jgi:tRNA A37 threonylcarbamoyltransferase TsaD
MLKFESFAQGRSGLYERAALVFANKIIPQMIHQTVFEGLAPERAVRQAHDKMADLLETSTR